MRRVLCCGISRPADDDDDDDQPGRPAEAKPVISQQQSKVSKRVEPAVPESKDDTPSFSLIISPPAEPQAEERAKSNLWDGAMGRLSEDDKAWINKNVNQSADDSSAEVREIIALVNQKRQECEAKRWGTVQVLNTTISLSDLASNAITWLNKFKEVGDTIVQYDPGHAALPWAAARFILQCAVSYQEHMTCSLISVEKTTRIVHRCQVYELLYNCDTLDAKVVHGLETALVELYASLLHVLARVGKFLSKRTTGRSLHAVFRPTEGSDLLSDLDKFETEVMKEASACESKRNAEANSKGQEQLHKLQSLLKLEEPVFRIDENVQKSLEKMEIAELIRILEWISPVTYNLHHERVRQARTKGTCDWILGRSQFYEWQSETSFITFWLQGFAGTGKTFITSRVIDMVAENLGNKQNHEGFAYFYCNQTEPTRRHALSVLRSFIRQLSSPKSMSGHVHSKLKQLYVESQLNGAGWTLDLCKEYLVHLFSFYPRTTIILDALDECEVEERRILLNIFDWASTSTSRPVKLFISSRPEGDIRQRLIHLPNVEISARNNSHDIARFIKESTDSPGPWSPVLGRNQALKEEIVETLIKESDGMFQWARLQVNQLRAFEHEQDLRDRLGKLPRDLKSSYDEIYQRIQDRPEYSRVRTLRALKWVMASDYPLSTHQLLNAIRIDPDTEKIDKPSEVTEEHLLGWCANLLIHDDDGSSSAGWRPCHLSVVEYLEGHFTMPTAHLFITAAKLFLLGVLPNDIEGLEGAKDPIFARNGLQDDARGDWVLYVQAYDKPSIDFGRAPYEKIAAMLKRFLGSPAQSTAAYARWILHSFGGYPFSRWRPFSQQRVFFSFVSPVANPLFGVCIYPVFYPLQDWWEPDGVGFDHLALNEDSESLLTMAAMSGCIPICDSLIKRGTPVNPENPGKRFGSPLTAAAAAGHAHMIKFLVESGAHVDLVLRDAPYGSALAAAYDTPIAQLLLDKGADPNLLLEANYYGSALAAAPATKTAQLLFDRGANVNLILEAGEFGSALASALARKRHDLVQLFIDNGADVNLPLSHGEYGTALIAAACKRDLSMAGLLVDHGADINRLSLIGNYGSALAAAASTFDGNEMVEFLIEKGAEANAILQGGRFGSALAAAVRAKPNSRQDLHVVDFLIEKGANVNAVLPAGAYGSALVSAASSNVLACKRLVEKGADVHLHVQHGFYGSPLIAAMTSWSDEAVRFLLDEGAEVDQIPNGEDAVFGTALMAGAYWGFATGIKMLLEAGARVNLQTEAGRFGTALIAARTDLSHEEGVFSCHPLNQRRQKRGKIKVEEMLLKHGATE
ncbi:hypothetical protein ACHAPT_010384 [Fusarium lateritium]